MKEIIYLDTDLMNSMLAQLDEGIVNSFSFEETNQETETEGVQTQRGKNAGLRGSLNVNTGLFPGGGLRVDGSLGNNASESSNESRTILEGQRDVLNKAFHDHALEVLKGKLVEGGFLSDGQNLKEGDLYLGEDSYRFYDFNLIKKSMDENLMRQIMLMDVDKLGLSYEEAKKLIQKPNPNAKDRQKKEQAIFIVQAYEAAEPVLDIFQKMNLMSSFASSMLEDLTLIKTNNEIGLLKKKYLRESVESLSFRTDRSRKVNYLVRIIGRKTEVYSAENLPVFHENELDIIPNMMLDIFLGSFNIIKKGDVIVTPIAIYYE